MWLHSIGWESKLKLSELHGHSPPFLLSSIPGDFTVPRDCCLWFHNTARSYEVLPHTFQKIHNLVTYVLLRCMNNFFPGILMIGMFISLYHKNQNNSILLIQHLSFVSSKMMTIEMMGFCLLKQRSLPKLLKYNPWRDLITIVSSLTDCLILNQICFRKCNLCGEFIFFQPKVWSSCCISEMSVKNAIIFTPNLGHL